MNEIILKDLSDRVIDLGFKVQKNLGPGLFESVYEGALCIELHEAGIPFKRQKAFPIYYHMKYIGVYVADIIVDNSIILELKSVNLLNSVMEAQLINYLGLSGIQVGYLMNFNGSRLVFNRIIRT
jgi:GxxExxY protein